VDRVRAWGSMWSGDSLGPMNELSTHLRADLFLFWQYIKTKDTTSATFCVRLSCIFECLVPSSDGHGVDLHLFSTVNTVTS
jgi:hypothetical protein